ncbi:hypothetical protein SPB21_35530 [Leptothoe sp. ISB3NOV94-8A]|nr:hypothetical protein [Leptothoe sp. LEGE 181152]
MRPIRQGDVILLPTSHVLGDELPHLTLLEGMSTGHSHRISKGIATLFSHQGELYLKVRSKVAILSHDEHRPLKVHYGNWKIYVQREYVPRKNGAFSSQLNQEFITEENADQEFLKKIVDSVRASSKQQLMADVLGYRDKQYSTRDVNTSSAVTPSSQTTSKRQRKTTSKKAGKRKSLSNWKYVVD